MCSNTWDSIPKKRSSSGAIILNKEGKILIVKPTYRDRWLIPGGIDEYNESPLSSCLREIKEEIGLELRMEKLLSVDYNFGSETYPEGLKYMFYGGIINEKQISNIKLAEEEISEYRFVAAKELPKLLVDKLDNRVMESLKALSENTTYYLEGQKRIL